MTEFITVNWQSFTAKQYTEANNELIQIDYMETLKLRRWG